MIVTRREYSSRLLPEQSCRRHARTFFREGICERPKTTKKQKGWSPDPSHATDRLSERGLPNRIEIRLRSPLVLIMIGSERGRATRRD
jgi:hypothetical protein